MIIKYSKHTVLYICSIYNNIFYVRVTAWNDRTFFACSTNIEKRRSNVVAWCKVYQLFLFPLWLVSNVVK